MEPTYITMSPALTWALGIAGTLIAGGVAATFSIVLSAARDIAVIKESFAKRQDVHDLTTRVVRLETEIEALKDKLHA